MPEKNKTNGFNQYDRVKCVKGDISCKLGAIGTVHDIDDDLIAVVIDGSSGWVWLEKDQLEEIVQ